LQSLQQTYQVMYQAYSNIFQRLGLQFRAVRADTGAIGGDGSHEFHVLADSGEDGLAYCPDSDYAANVELAEALPPSQARTAGKQTMQLVETPKQTTCEEVAALLNIPLSQTVKSLAVMVEGQFYLCLLRGDHQLNEVKLGKLDGMAKFRFASADEIRAHLNDCPPGFIGPVGVSAQVHIIADRAVAAMSDFVCGANQPKLHLQGVNFGRDLPEPGMVADIRNVVEGDPSPDGKGKLTLCRGIEVGHIFQLRTKYAKAMKATYLDEQGQSQVMEMGCYGIGVSRIVAAAIEQGHDDKGIIFPTSLAPFSVAITPIAMDKNEQVKQVAEQLYQALLAAGVDVLLDDRGERPGVMFADMELIGVPQRIVIGERGLQNNMVEYQARTEAESVQVAVTDIVDFVLQKLKK
jgi:prolyl-tRNA synthetase